MVCSITITSDIKIYSEGLARILSSRCGLKVAGTASNYAAAMDLIASQQTDVLLLDMTMAEACPLALSVAKSKPQIKIVALAVNYNEQDVLQCVEVGINCYVPREASVNQLVDAITQAQFGECYCPPRIAALLVKNLQNLSSHAVEHQQKTPRWVIPVTTKQPQKLLQRLTRRERQITKLLADGLSNKQIARELSIEVSTVKNHVHNLLVKLEVENRMQVVSLLQKIPQQVSPVNP